MEQKKDWREPYSTRPNMLAAIMANAKIPRRYQGADLHLDFPSIAENFDPDVSYFIHGPVGGGKTYLMCAMVKAILFSRWHRKEIALTTARRMLINIQQSFGKPRRQALYADDEEEYLAKTDCMETYYSEVELLALDDLGTEHVTDWAEGTIREILNARYNELLPTYITANCSIKDLGDRAGQQIVSRITEDYHLIELTGKDRRAKR